MDANAFRFLLIALASSVVVFLNFPWRSAARSMTRCAAALIASPQPVPVERSPRAYTASPAHRARGKRATFRI